MTPPELTPAGRAALRREAARILGVVEAELASYLRPLVEASARDWRAMFVGDTKAELAASMVLAIGEVEGLVRPRLLETYDTTACFEHLRAELAWRYPGRLLDLEPVLRRLFGHAPRLVDNYEALRLLHVAYEDHPPSSLASLLRALGVPELLRVGDEQIDAVAAAARVRADNGVSYAHELLDAGVLPPAIETLARRRGPRLSRRAVSEPVRVLAGMAAEAGALYVYGAPSRVSAWESAKHVYPHCSRLARVCGLNGAPTLAPRLDLLGLIHVDNDVANAYDAALLADAEELAEDWIDADRYPEAEARQRASASLMKGFGPFQDYLRRAADRGAPVLVLPNGIAVPRRSTTAYQGSRDDLCPPPDIFRLLLASAPGLLEGEENAEFVILQLVSAARASVVLALQRAYWIEVPQGAIIHVPPAANKTGRTLLFVAKAWMDFFGITREWLPESATEDPPQYRRDELAATVELLCRRFEAEKGITIPHQSVRFTRSGYAQLLRPRLHGLEREAISAQLGQRSRWTRANYWRAWADEVGAARRRFTWGRTYG